MACSECGKEVEKGVYFVCGACSDKPRICSLCIVRLHIKHGEEIIERKALTEQDLMDRLEKVNQGAAVAAQTTINIGNIVDRLNDCGAEMKQGLEQAQQAFGEVSSSLRQINRNSTAEEADAYVNVAEEISEGFKQLEKKVSEVRKDLSISLENSIKEFNDRIKVALQSGRLPILKREIKGEPIDNDEDVVLLETNHPYTPEAVLSPLVDLFRRSPTPYPEAGEENAGEALGAIERPPIAETSQTFTIPRNPQRNRLFGEQEVGEQQLAPEDALDLITNQARHIRVARTPSPDEQSADGPPLRRRRRQHEEISLAGFQRLSSRVAGRPQHRYSTQTLIDRSNRRRRRMFSAVSDEAASDQPGPSNR